MTEHEVHTLTGAYAADALPEAERHSFDDHLEQCPSCQQEVAELFATTARLAAAVSTPAPAAMRSRVLAEVSRTRQVSPLVASLEARRPAVPWYRSPIGIAASFLLVISLGLAAFAVDESRRADQAERTAARIAAIATDPDRAEASRPISSGGAGVVIAAGDGAIFRADGLRVLPADRTYQLWIMDDKGGARSVGLLGRGGDADIQRLVEGVKTTDQIGLTVEPKGGSPGPTTTPLLVLPVPA
jgi:anti-sigma-K factor RskA